MPEAIKLRKNVTLILRGGMIQSRRSLRVEWYIVILIVFEIALTLYEMLIRRT